MALKVSVSGIRGIVGQDLFPETVLSYVAAFLTTLGRSKGTVLIGRDSRNSGKLLEKIVEASANALGWNCINIGIAPTPTALLATRRLGCHGGIVITASHNPAQWNALKLCDARGLFIKAQQVEKISNLVTQGSNFAWKGHQDLGETIVHQDAAPLHIREVLRFLDCERIRKNKFRVVIDPCSAAGAVVDRPLLESLGCTVYSINEDITGNFPRGAEPVPENLSPLASQVKKRKAHVGFAQDPDADRLSVVSDGGVPIGEEYTLILAGETYLRRKKTDIAVNLSTSMMVDDLARRHGCRVFRTKIGEINVTDLLRSKKLCFGGEGNGGVIVPEINPCRDSLVAMGLILELLSMETGRKLSHIIEDFPSYCIKKDKISHTVSDVQVLYKHLLRRAKEIYTQHSFDTQDGIKIYNNEEWLHIRASNTEPVVRIMAESRSTHRTNQLIAEGKNLVAAS